MPGLLQAGPGAFARWLRPFLAASASARACSATSLRPRKPPPGRRSRCSAPPSTPTAERGPGPRWTGIDRDNGRCRADGSDPSALRAMESVAVPFHASDTCRRTHADPRALNSLKAGQALGTVADVLSRLPGGVARARDFLEKLTNRTTGPAGNPFTLPNPGDFAKPIYTWPIK
jgi:hypothetical protein